MTIYDLLKDKRKAVAEGAKRRPERKKKDLSDFVPINFESFLFRSTKIVTKIKNFYTISLDYMISSKSDELFAYQCCLYGERLEGSAFFFNLCLMKCLKETLLVKKQRRCFNLL